MTQLTDPWAPVASVVPDFVWYGPGGSLFSTLEYVVNGVTYPPTTDAYYSGDHSRYASYSTPINTLITFDAINSLTLSGVSQTYVPPNLFIASYRWDFGNGQTASGAVASTTYTVASPDLVTVLTTVDNLGRSRTAFHNMNLQSSPQIGGSIPIGQGPGRT